MQGKLGVEGAGNRCFPGGFANLPWFRNHGKLTKPLAAHTQPARIVPTPRITLATRDFSGPLLGDCD